MSNPATEPRKSNRALQTTVVIVLVLLAFILFSSPSENGNGVSGYENGSFGATAAVLTRKKERLIRMRAERRFIKTELLYRCSG